MLIISKTNKALVGVSWDDKNQPMMIGQLN